MKNMKVKDIVDCLPFPGVVGLGLLDGKPNLFTWGSPWTITKVKFSHISPALVYEGKEVPEQSWYQIYGTTLTAAHGHEGKVWEQTLSQFTLDDDVWVDD